MAEDNEEKLSTIAPISLDLKEELLKEDIDDPVAMLTRIMLLNQYWADIQLIVVSPNISPIFPPYIIQPEQDENTGEKEHVYPIHDYGFKMATSKGEDMFTAGQSMCKLYFTIEKMVALLVERMNSSGIDKNTEVQIATIGFEYAKRKLVESIINLEYNVVLTNFDPAEWGEYYINNVQRMVEKGMGYPSAAPRENYKLSSGTKKSGPKGAS